MPVWLALLIDTLIAALGLLVFSLFYFLLPQDLEQNAVVLPGATAAQSAEAAPPDESETAGVAASGDAQSGETPVVSEDPNSWRVRFADKFTDGEVVRTVSSYKSANVSVAIDRVEKDGVVYFVTDIYIADLKYFKTAFAKGAFNTANDASTVDIAAENNAIVAINGDYCTQNRGVVVRNGVLYREKMYKSDLLVMNYDGSMQTFSPGDFDLEAIKTNGAYQVWTFGPMLLKDGAPMEKFNSAVNPVNPRTAIGYYEPGHYCFVVVDGRQDGYSEGYTTAELSQLMASLGCAAAYNLDGGKSTEMAFNGAFYNQPYHGGRGTSDIIFIADE